jgi:hypothetical protein
VAPAYALDELDARRYQLVGMPNRLAFATSNEKARALALDLGAGSSPRLAAELIESARVQGLPTWPMPDHLSGRSHPRRSELVGSLPSWGMDRSRDAT